MPASALASAIISSIVSAIVDSAGSTPAQPLVAPMNRPFAAEIKFGELAGPPSNGQVVINDTVYTASAGLQIRNDRNLIIMPSTLGTELPIRYQLDLIGNVWRIWILSPAEVAAAKSL